MTRDEAEQFCRTWDASGRGEVDVAMVDVLLKLSERAERRAVLIEREACAQIADEWIMQDENAERIEEAIRSRP